MKLVLRQLRLLIGETLLRWGFELAQPDYSDASLFRWEEFIAQRSRDMRGDVWLVDRDGRIRRPDRRVELRSR